MVDAWKMVKSEKFNVGETNRYVKSKREFCVPDLQNKPAKVVPTYTSIYVLTSIHIYIYKYIYLKRNGNDIETDKEICECVRNN